MSKWAALSRRERREILMSLSDSEKEKLITALAKALIRYENKKKELEQLMKI